MAVLSRACGCRSPVRCAGPWELEAFRWRSRFTLAPLSLPAGVEIGAALLGATLPFPFPPERNGLVVSAAEHGWHLHAPEEGRSRVVGVLQQESAMAFLLQGCGRANGAGQEPHHPIDHGHGREFSTGQNEVADGDFLIRQTTDAFVKPFVVSAEDHQMVLLLGPAFQIGLVQGSPLGRHQKGGLLPMPGDGFKGGKHWLRLQHHARPTAVGLIVHFPVAVLGVVPGVVEMELCDPPAQGPSDDSQLMDGSKNFGHQGDHINAHGGIRVVVSAVASQAVAPAGFLS